MCAVTVSLRLSVFSKMTHAFGDKMECSMAVKLRRNRQNRSIETLNTVVFICFAVDMQEQRNVSERKETVLHPVRLVSRPVRQRTPAEMSFTSY